MTRLFLVTKFATSLTQFNLHLAKPDQPIISNAYSNPTSITVIWKLGESDGGKPVTLIVIEYLASGNGTEWQNVTIQTKNRHSASHTIHNLRSGTEYKLRLRAINQIGTSQPSVNFIEETDGDRATGLKKKNVENKGESVDMMVMVFGVAGAFLVLIIAIVIICILMRNIQRNSARKAAENAQRLPKRVNSDAVSMHILLLYYLYQHSGVAIPIIQTHYANIPCSLTKRTTIL